MEGIEAVVGDNVPSKDKKNEPTKDASSDPPKDWQALMGNDLLMKTLVPSDSGMAVQLQDVVRVDLVGRVAPTPDDASGPIFLRATDQWVVAGDNRTGVLPAAAMGIRFLHEHETAAIWSHSKYAYGPGRRTASYDDQTTELGPHTNVLYEITLREIVNVTDGSSSSSSSNDNNNSTPTSPSPSTELSLCQTQKECANDIVRHEHVTTHPHARQRAIALYQRAAEQLEALVSLLLQQQRDDGGSVVENDATNTDTDTMAAAAKDCLLDCLNNIAAVHLQCQSYHEAKQACVAVLTKDPNNFKALVRAAKAALLDPASSYEEVEAAIAAATEQCQTNEQMKTDVERIKADFIRRRQAHKRRQKTMYAKMAKATVEPNSGVKSSTSASSVVEEISSATTIQEPTRLEKVRNLPWSKILQYAFQLVLPIVMYYHFTTLKQKQEMQ